MARHAKRFTGVPRQLLDRERIYLLAWVGTRWEVVAESTPGAEWGPRGAPHAASSQRSGEEACGVSWAPVSPEEIRDRRSAGTPWTPA